MWSSMASSCFSVYACLLIGRAGDCGEELCARIYYLELFRADLAPNFRRSAAYHHPGGHTSWSQPGACPASQFPLLSRRRKQLLCNPKAQWGWLWGNKEKQTNSQGRVWKEAEQPSHFSLGPRNAKRAGSTDKSIIGIH